MSAAHWLSPPHQPYKLIMSAAPDNHQPLLWLFTTVLMSFTLVLLGRFFPAALFITERLNEPLLTAT
jgi:hypothetical protein